ncbi:MAG: hypothetical protein ACI4ED_06065 [Suilimivivens sp.]
MEEKELLETLVKHSEKQLFYSRIAAFAAVVSAVVLAVCLLVIVPSVMKTVNQANDIMEQVSETLVLADTAIESVTQMSQSITTMGNNMDSFITENSESIQQIMKKMDEIDFEGLNSAIKDLGDVVEPLANFFGIFK